VSKLDDVRIATPCRASWGGMFGDERVRYCPLCKLNVYNLSGMQREDAEALVSKTEGRVCVTFLRRADGMILTQDCPVGVAARLKRRLANAAACLAALVALGWVAIAGRGGDEIDGPLVEGKPPVVDRDDPSRVLELLPPERLMGAMERVR
jgi:hypothetical protein